MPSPGVNNMSKIINYNQLDQLPTNKKVVLVGGVFDLLHYGHIKFLKEAKNCGDISKIVYLLIVALESDKNVRRSKGKDRPIHNQQIRAEILSELTCVDYIILLPEMKTDQEYFDLVKTVKPDVIAVTSNDPQLENKRRQIDSVKGKLKIVIDKINTPSTSKLAKILKVE